MGLRTAPGIDDNEVDEEELRDSHLLDEVAATDKSSCFFFALPRSTKEKKTENSTVS